MKYIYFFTYVSVFAKSFALDCYWNSRPYKYFSSRSSYNTVRGDIRDSVTKTNGCEPISIWSIYRHGARYPGKDFARKMKDAISIRDEIQSSYLKGNSGMCAQDVENLNNWRLDNNIFDNILQLSEDGYDEMLGIGKRLKEAYPELLANLTKGDYTFRPALRQRMEDSGKAFLEGLGNKNLLMNKPENDSDYIAPYTSCGKYHYEVKLNLSKVYAEANKYKESPEYLQSKMRIQRRTGTVLTNTQIEGLSDLCRYNSTAVYNSPWCAIFTTEDMKIQEYLGDIQHYYRNGYGIPVNKIFGHFPLADLFRTFQRVKLGEEKKITSYFTHATMMDMIYGALGLFKDQNPLTSAYRNPNRKWRSTFLSAFSANIVAVLHRCNVSDYKIVFYHNEELLSSICNNGVCSWQQFEQMLTPFLNTTMDFCEFIIEPMEP